MVHWTANWIVGSAYPLSDEYSIWLLLPLAIVALSWSVRDQQRRCRTCLRRLELPVEIGRAGSVLLNWAGTEMVCPQGHGILYLPDSPANSLDQGRWSTLDDSWQSLFARDRSDASRRVRAICDDLLAGRSCGLHILGADASAPLFACGLANSARRTARARSATV